MDLAYSNANSNAPTRRRKGVKTASVAKRYEQMRNAQRALQIRKSAHLANLESESERLKKENDALKEKLGISFPRNTQRDVECSNPACATLMQTLENRIAQITFTLTPPSFAHDAYQSQILAKQEGYSSDMMFDSACHPNGGVTFGESLHAPHQEEQSSEQIYGPIDIEPFKADANKIEPLAGAKILDRMFSLFEIIREHNRMLQRCGVLDRVEVIRIYSEFHLKYEAHVMHWCHICIQHEKYIPKPRSDLDTQILPLSIKFFRDTLREIPGLANSFPCIDDMCDFWMRTEEYNTQEFFRTAYMLRKLLYQCGNLEDMVKFWLAFFSMRQSKLHDMDEILASAESDII
ncbi:hypothetical protein HK100_001223 [Physocladia obscura]|uniref:BZIP domain-containing protein n=1 Tax=Physocladia obscura TaxID=109957 RepID=A0AAD5SX36_9FUNG|nr:hypothetical protein HK100_001223 [Physocladia obscura]